MNESYEHAELATEALYPMGCGMALRGAAIELVGEFDGAMLNYYDDVDYGVRLWRAGFKVKVAPDAWIDHGTAAGDSPRKRLLCERHRMRVVLKHVPVATLGRWVSFELRALRAASGAGRGCKLRAAAWNMWHLPGTLASRRRLRAAPLPPERLVDSSWGDGFPAGVPLRLRPRPEAARAELDMADADADSLLLHGWFPPERTQGRSMRWAAARAAALLSLKQPARRLTIDYTHVPVDCGDVRLRLRRLDGGDLPVPMWENRLRWQYLARSLENHPLSLPAGDYELDFEADLGWSDPPRETRTLALALARVELAESFELAEGVRGIGSPESERHLVNGWYEGEQGPEGRYRWASERAEVAVRLATPARDARLGFRLPPVANGGLTVSIAALVEPG